MQTHIHFPPSLAPNCLCIIKVTTGFFPLNGINGSNVERFYEFSKIMTAINIKFTGKLKQLPFSCAFPHPVI